MRRRWFPFLLVALFAVVCSAAPAGDEFQAAVERAMAGRAGAAVVVDVDSGRLLASYRLEVAARTLAAPGSTLKPFTLATLLGVIFQIDDPTTAGIAGAVAIAYVIAQALVDKAQVERVAQASELGLSEARKASAE